MTLHGVFRVNEAMLIQIYEITSPEEAAALSAIGVDHVGVLIGYGEFPREQPVARVREIFAGVHGTAKRCALSLSADLKSIGELVAALSPDILHLGAAPDRLFRLERCAGPQDVAAAGKGIGRVFERRE